MEPNSKPNDFLIEMVRGISPGDALDVGMGQGRNAIYLAQQRWTVTGFDPADRAVAVAEDEVKRLGVKLKTQILRTDDFEYGIERWDLVVLSYVSLRDLIPRIYDSLKPGGSVVVEGYHRDATKTASIGGGVVFDTNELLKLFEPFRIVRYEDTEGMTDFPLRQTRLVRLCAQRPRPPGGVTADCCLT
jgi:SAM-dependent methyltransferase